MIDFTIKKNNYLRLAGISFAIYSIIEVIDCVYLILIVLNLAPNLYLNLGIVIPEILEILTNQPVFFLPFFGCFTLMRVMSTLGILRNKLWGFYLGVISLVLTMLMTLIFIPVGFIELFICSIILTLLLIGFFEDTPIVKKNM